ncbi:MAG: tetratricopeptide repeat protein [Hamadaea sp.]|uniref:tetratricopeptide repeat protein n=1 Tax=Hamadaea sp. TaxID=2024425 RepID=UPI00180FD446|nr:tetratricopeptide repeat protein [Hamadaea sp.]NUT21829.1 tetratricopeptide repeat protein [Hamadaea sp.]
MNRAVKRAFPARPPNALPRCNLAISYERQGRYDEALAELHRALAEVRALPHPRFEAFLLSSGLANVYFRSGRPRLAVDCLEQAMVIYAESDDPLDQARLALALSWAYDELAEPAPALRNARRALELAEEIGERRVAAQATAAIAAGLRLTGDLAGSLDARLHAGNMLRALGMGAADLENDLALAALHEQAGRLGVATDLYAAAATRAATMAARHQQAKALAGAGRTRRTTDPDTAERFLLAAADLLDQVAPHEAAEIRSTLQPFGHAVP